MQLKKLLKLGLSLSLALSLVACGNNSTGGTVVESTPSSSNSSTESDSSTDAGTSSDNSETAQGSGEFLVEEGKLIVATNAAFPPYGMIADDDGVAGTGYEGIDMELAAALAEEMGLEVEILDMEFSSALAAPDLGKADVVISGVTVTEDRKRNMDFSDTYTNAVQVVIVPEDSDISSLDDLDGLMIGTQEGTTGYIYASSEPEDGGFGEANVLALSTGSMAVESLLSGKVDCVIIDNEPAKAFVASTSGLRILEADFATEEYAVGMKKGNSELLDAINSALASLDAQGTIDEIISSYIN